MFGGSPLVLISCFLGDTRTTTMGGTMLSRATLVACLAGMLLGLSAVCAHAVDVTLDPSTRHQTMIGFGGHNPESHTNWLANDLGMSVHRDWINSDNGASSGSGWSELKALKNAGVKYFIASPWSPPPHMKWNDNTSGKDAMWNRLSNGLGPYNDYVNRNRHPEKGGKRNYYPDFAAHLAKYAKNFKQQVGIDLYGISPQNEPRFAQPYASCVYSPGQMRDITMEIGKKFAEEGLGHIKIFVSEDMLAAFGQQVMVPVRAEQSKDYVGAVAVHGYSNGVDPTPANKAASLWGSAYNFAKSNGHPLWMTETSGFLNWLGGSNSEGDKSGALELGVALYQALKYGKITLWTWWRLSVTADYWNDETLILHGNRTKNYYVSKNYYKYIRPGAVQIDVDDSGDDAIGAVAFVHDDNRTLTVVLLNTSTSQKQVSLTGTDLPTFDRYVTSASKDFFKESGVAGGSVTLPKQSVTTLYGTNYSPPAVDVARSHRHTAQPRPGVTASRAHARVYGLDGRLVGRGVDAGRLRGAYRYVVDGRRGRVSATRATVK